MKLKDILPVLNCDEFFISDGMEIYNIRLYEGQSLDEFLGREVQKITPADNCLDIDLVELNTCKNCRHVCFGDNGRHKENEINCPRWEPMGRT